MWLSAHDPYAVTRYADVRAVLENPDVFYSGKGVGLNDFINAIGQGTTLMSDGDQHRRLRDVILRPLTAERSSTCDRTRRSSPTASSTGWSRGGEFDAVTDLAALLPATWVPELLGWPEDARDRLIDWGSANFDPLGPPNARTDAAGPSLMEMAAYADQLAQTQLPEGSMAAGILDAAARGDIEPGQAGREDSGHRSRPGHPRGSPHGRHQPVRRRA